MFFLFDRDYFGFNRDVKDMRPYQIVRNDKDSKITIVYNAVGLGKEDINVTVDIIGTKEYLNISGKKKNELTGNVCSIQGRFQIDSSQIDWIDWKVENGIVYVTVNSKKPEQAKFEIKYNG